MQYTKIQKFLSSLLIFSMFFGLTFRVPIFNFSVFAGNSEYYNLVSVIVDEDTYPNIKSELQRYAKDIQGVLENTKVVIIPTPVNTPAFNIASLNESLYFDGYKGIDKNIGFESKLIGTVLVGNFNLAMVYDGDKSSKTILPFVDFKDKVYIYNHKTNRYEKNNKNLDGIKAEIWHGIISPNLGSKDKNIEGLKEYFYKNHDFYKGTGNFKFSEGILNGDKRTGVKTGYEPFVFYYDQFREEKGLNYTLYKGYEAYLNNKEDIVYNRYTRELADKITKMVMGTANDTISNMSEDLSNKIDVLGDNSPFGNLPEELLKGDSQTMDTFKSPDIQTRYITDNMTKKFLEIFAKGVIGDFRSDVHNAGRYNKIGGEVNVDLIPYLITVLDIVNDGIIKDINTDIENKIDDLVKNGLSRNIAIPETIRVIKFKTHSGTTVSNDDSCYDEYTNFLVGNISSDINSAKDCSINRGNSNSGKLIEANRGYNFNKSTSDYSRINNKYCNKNLSNGKSLKGLWGGNSPLNIDPNQTKLGDIQLKFSSLNQAIEPLYDIGGARVNNNLKNPSPLDCFDNNLLSTTRKNWKLSDDGFEICKTEYEFRTSNGTTNWTCTYDNLISKNNFNTRFETFYKLNPEYNKTNLSNCKGIVTHSNQGNKYTIENKKYKIVTISSDGDSGGPGICEYTGPLKKWNFKFIPSYITHKSPTAEEIKGEIKSQFAQDLPVDKNRYIDFIGAKGNLLKIDYPALFRINILDKTKITLETASEALDKELNKKSEEINKLISNNNPNTLTGKDLELYNILKVKNTTYPNSDFDLVKYLKDKPVKTFKVGDKTKTITYYDSLVFAIYWNNLSSVSAKYAAIFDNYLNDGLVSSDKYFLPKTKREYEVAYLGASGDARNMYIKMDPEGKAENPYGDILSKNIDLSSMLLGSNIGGGKKDSEEGLFKCAPPDGVPIWEWIPAVMCWLKEMMPPTISLSDGECGQSFLDMMSEDEKQEFNECKGDFDKNGINDCIENKLGNDGILDLESDSKKYYYNKKAELKAIFKDKNGKIVKLLNNSKVKFELVKIEGAKDLNKDISDTNKKVVYDINNKYKSDNNVLSKYVTFNTFEVPVVRGIAKYGVGLKSTDANIYLKASLKINDSDGKESIFIESNDLLIKIRGDRLFNTSYKLENNNGKLTVNSGINSIKVSDKNNIFLVDGNKGDIKNTKNIINNVSLAKEKLVLVLDNISSKGKNIAINYPINIKIKDSKNKIVTELDLNNGDLNSFKAIAGIKKSGSYKIEITDYTGFKTTKNIELIPESPYIIETTLGSTIMEAGGNVSTNFITIYDKYHNVVSGEFYNYDINIKGYGVVFLDTETLEQKGTTFEGYKVFRLKSTNNPGDNKIEVTISDLNGNKLIEGERDLKVLEKINLEAKLLSSNVKVGYNKYKYEIKLTDKNGNLLTNFNSRVYFNASPIYLKTSGAFSEIKGGKGIIEFETKTIASQDIGVEFQVEGLNNIIKKKLTILPEKPVKVDLTLNKNKIEASLDSSAILNVELKDRYNNVVFNDNSTKTSIEVLDKYKNIIVPDSNLKSINGGVTTYKLGATLNPGIAYFKVLTIPSLVNNSFTIKDKSGDLVVKGVGENVGKIETYYFWNNDKIKDKKYNSIYTTLLGSDYGNINEEGYLAGSLLFNKNNRSLVVTSLLNNPFNYSNVLKLGNYGNLEVISSSDDLSQDISVTTEFINNKLALNIFNNSLNTYIGKVLYNFGDDIKLVACESDLNSCINNDKTSISLKGFSEDYKVYLKNDELILKNINGKVVLTIKSDGTIIRSGILSYEFNKDNTDNYLGINIKSGKIKIAELAFNFQNAKTSVSRSENSFGAKINSLKNSILVLLKTNSYGTYTSGNIYNKTTMFYYNDPFKNDKALNSFSKRNTYGYENFVNKPGLGWKDGNKSLLEFASGKSVGDSVKDFMSFSVVNLGDPVISLKKIKKQFVGTDIDKQFDSTIGKLLSTDEDIKDYNVFDYNNDNKLDILLIKDDKYLKLLENKNIDGQFIDKGNLAKVVDLGSTDLVKTGDFTGDGFDDIFFVNTKGNPYLLNNVDKNFTRYGLKKIFNLKGKIVRAESFDMDNDGVTDIVTLDDAGSINIFYGKDGTSQNPDFTKLNVSDGYGVTLNSDVRSDNGLVYFDGLYQLSNNSSETNNIERKLFIKYPYTTENQNVDYKNVLNGTEKLHDSKKSSYFIKSDFSKYSGLKVEKVFKDRNSGYLSSGDLVDVTITLTNTSGKKINNLAYAEKVDKVFDLKQSSVKIIGDDNAKIIDGEVGYNFLVSGLNLNSNDQIVITYEAKVRPIQYGYIEVGLFEKDEVGDDLFGDILLKKDNKNCSNPVEIFRSTAKRSYVKGVKTPTCNEDKIKLPNELEQNSIDKDGNGIPDYIDELSDPTNVDGLENYAKEQLDSMQLDSDNDGIPDSEDFLEGGVLDSIFTGTSEFDSESVDGTVTIGLGESLQKVDSKLDNVQEILNGLNCGNASCFASPLNWAPLAPGNDPVFMGKTIGDGLKVGEGLPIMSAMTGIPLYGSWGCIPLPTIWPISPIGLDTTCGSNSIGAGGYLGINSPTNFFRLFVTPTLTGGVGTAICFGGPASIAGNAVPNGLAPLIPGGNCIVVAKKMNFCNGDGSSGDPASIGNPIYSGNGSFGIINGNCGTSQTDNEKVNNDISTLKTISSSDDGKDAVKKIFGYLPGDFSEEPITPLFSQGGNEASLSLDLSGDSGSDFSDIIKIQQPRISSFPSWLMDWVTRQIEEIANKLTDFPTVFIILPDFSGIFDKNWGENSGNSNKYNKDAVTLDKKVSSGDLSKGLTNGVKKVNSGIKEAYEFIGGIPLVYIEQETVDITLPWITQAEIDKTIELREQTLKQREDEYNRAKNEWSMGATCSGTADEIKKCKEENAALNHINADVDLGLENLISGLRQNLEVIKTYKEIPERINKLINVKQEYLEQILCNIQSISNILGGRIGKNGDRFKAWVELYILIKAILKSWQMLIDIFVDYETECHECKNERQDALDSEFKLISFIVPKIPIIRFPKWPDIIIDLHNIRAGLRVALPEFAINTKPIILPTLPKLKLPSVPNANISLNLDISLPVLPEIDIPELPPLPNLPSVELPDLPPPPKLPKMFASIEVVLDIIKLITKAMCILKSLPITPEWRAGDQIAFLTERSGYLGTDFFEISMPEFSFPFIDAITVTTYVNLEFETDFIVELAKQIAMPINNFTNNFTNIFDIALPNLDLSNVIPKDIDVDINLTTDDLKKISSGDMSPINYQIKAAGEGFKENLKDDIGETIENIGGGIENTINKFNGDKQNLENTIDEIGFNNKKITRNDLLIILANRIGVNIKQLEKVLNNGKNELVSNLEFKKLINKALASKSVSSNPKMEGIIDLWDKVNKMTYSKENKIIKELQDNNREKFDTLKDIINTEIVRNKELKKKLNNIGVNKLVTKVGYTSDNKIDLYNKSLSKYNDKFKKSAEKLFTYKDTKKQELDQMKDDLMSKIKTPLKNYSTGINKRTNEKLLTKVSSRNTLLSATTAVNSNTVTVNSCQAQQDSDYKRTYKGIYVVENDKSYRLFDYLGELQGDEIIKMYDMDGDNDDDVLYFVNKQLYLKENLENKSTKIYVSENPIVVNIDDNKFYNGDVFYESINNAHEIGDDHGNINIGFTAPTNINLNKFRLGFYDRVDKYINEDNNSYRPKFIKKDIVDAISDKDNITKIEETNLYKRSNNLVYIKNIGDLSGVKLKTKEIKDISTRLNSGIVVNIRKGKKIYAGKNNFTITYINEESENKLEQKISIPAYTNIEFKSNIKIIGIEGNGYVMGYTEIVYKGTDIRKLLNKPLSMGTTISYVGSNYETKDISYIDLEYYDGSELGLDFNKVKKWELFDLGLKTKDYSIRLSRENDYYYAKIYAFKNNINSTLSKQILFSPQKESDINPPELSLKNIKIPVYQKHITDLTNEIYEDSGMSGIKKIVVDFDLDLTKDSDGDGNKKNDYDLNLDGEYKNQINILKNPAYIKFEFKPFNKIFKKKIGISITDANNNVGYSEILLDVYSPIPTITSYANGLINGKLKEEYLTDEPINLYRFRGGVITRLETKDNKKISYTKSGYYSFDVKTSGTGLKLFDSENKQIAFINEKTGKIFIKDNSITTDVLSSSNIKNDSVFPKIILKKNNLEIFYQYLRLKDISKVRFVNNFEEVNGRGIYFKFTDLNHYSYYTIPEGLDYNPGALSIYRNTNPDKQALFTIFTDGRINTINDDDFKIKYDFYGDNIVLKLYDKNDFGNREIGRILFVTDSEYIMK